MITYVNTVLVSNVASSNILSAAPSAVASMNTPSTDAGKFLIQNVDTNAYITTAANAAAADRIRVGIVTKKNAVKVNYTTGATTYEPIVKWSNVIIAKDVKNIEQTTYASSTEDTAYINFRSIDPMLVGQNGLLSDGGKRIIVRLTFKDLPTRYRKWTESYEYVTEEGDTVATISTNIANLINKQYKRARVVASLGTASAGKNPGDPDTITTAASAADANAVILTAMPYDDDDSVDSINWANKVRFNVNVYYTDPAADGWESKNKHFPKGVVITKTPGNYYTAAAKLVRDRESQAMGYQGILNRGEGTWPIIKPAMETDLQGRYDAITLEFENMYRAADDIFRKTKQAVEIYINNGSTAKNGGSSNALYAILNAFVTGSAS